MNVERPEDEDPPRPGGLSAGDPLSAGDDPLDAAPRPPKAPREEPREARGDEPLDPPTDPNAGARSAFGAAAPDVGTLARQPPELAPERPAVPAPPPREPGVSVAPPGYPAEPAGPPGYAGYAGGPVPPGALGPPTAAQPTGTYVLADWWRRLVAFLVDGVLVGIVAVIIIVIITGAAGGVGFIGGEDTGIGGLIVGFVVSALIVAVVALCYAPAYMARTGGQTLGRQLVGIRVVRTNGQPTTFWWSMLREFVVKNLLIGVIGNGITLGFPVASLLDGLWPLWDDENRALHDMVVQSRVVRA